MEITGQRADGQLHGCYTPKERAPAHPRPMGVISALFKSNELVADNAGESGTQPPNVSAWLRTMVPSTPLWELQLVVLSVLLISDRARAAMAMACPQPVVLTWLDTLPERIRDKMFGRHGGKPLTVIQSAMPASQIVVTELMALRRAYEYCECV